MQEVSKYPNGTFCWVELTTTDPEAAKAFYGALFGWESFDTPFGESMVHTMLLLEGKEVAALSGMPPQMEAQGLPPVWTSYVSVDNLDETAANVAGSGGTLLTPPFDVLDHRRMAMVEDSTGATFGLWEAKKHIGARLVNMPNALVWNELATRDADKASAFYAALFGWTTRVDQAGAHLYTTYLNNGRRGAGMLQMNEQWGDMPSHWMPYFAVEDCAAAAAKAESLGASLGVPPTEIPNVGTFSLIRDPQGAVFTVMSFLNPLDPPPSVE
jgi:predicted enzyme related to lactoylglutathione lyase